MKKVLFLLPLIILGIAAFTFSNQQEGVQPVIAIGKKAPEIKYPNPEGKQIALSSLKGKLVLIDFWASWCGPCRRANPTVVAAYNKYKDATFIDEKGFTVFSVSLDKNAQQWKTAIQQDGLVWPNHVSDLKGWESAPAGLYGVRSIPRTFLIDGKGIIVAEGYFNLVAELEKRLKK